MEYRCSETEPVGLFFECTTPASKANEENSSRGHGAPCASIRRTIGFLETGRVNSLDIDSLKLAECSSSHRKRVTRLPRGLDLIAMQSNRSRDRRMPAPSLMAVRSASVAMQRAREVRMARDANQSSISSLIRGSGAGNDRNTSIACLAALAGATRSAASCCSTTARSERYRACARAINVPRIRPRIARAEAPGSRRAFRSRSTACRVLPPCTSRATQPTRRHPGNRSAERRTRARRKCDAFSYPAV